MSRAAIFPRAPPSWSFRTAGGGSHAVFPREILQAGPSPVVEPGLSGCVSEGAGVPPTAGRRPTIVRAGETSAFPGTRQLRVNETWSAIRKARAAGGPARDPARASSARGESPLAP